ncbi:MAG TPA: cation-translocating P-type ATPase, partial [Egicoccus sp.]
AVAADGRLIESAVLRVAEASLTGESEAVLKRADMTLDEGASLGDRRNMVFSGTAVATGRGRAIVTGTGMATEMGTIARLLGTTEDDPTPLQREIAGVGKILGLGVIVIALVVMGGILLTSDLRSAEDYVEVLLVGVSLAVAAVPEGLPAILSVVLALGVQRMAKRKAIVKRLQSVEALGSASVICSDKTGTLTQNEMTLRRVLTGSGEVELTGTGYDPDGEAMVDGRPLGSDPGDGVLAEEVRVVLLGGSLANDATLHHDDEGWSVQGDPTEAAFLVAGAKIGVGTEHLDERPRVAEVPFTSERKLMSTVHRDPDEIGRTLVTKGAPDVLLTRCATERVAGRDRPLDDVRREQILADVDRLACDAYRTLAVASHDVDSHGDLDDPAALEADLVYLGLVGILDPPREEARAAIDAARSAGIRVMMITGDHPRTAVRIAGDLGITAADGRVVTGGEIQALDDEAFRQAVREVSVYARVAPEHKLRIVDALQADGELVAMTGDGVNDAPALRSADIGVAMGITGTDVSKEAADLILADDNFATIVAGVREGRAILSNIRKFLRYLLSSNIGEVLTMFLGVVLAAWLGLTGQGEAVAVPLLATQILWINLLTDTAPALAMGVDPPPDDVMDRPPRKLTDRIIDRTMMIDIGYVGLIMALASLFALDLYLPGGFVEGTGDLTEARTAAFTTLVFAQLFNCFNARSGRVSAFHHLFTNAWLWAAIGLSSVLQVAVVHVGFLNRPFGTAPLSLGQWATCAALASLVLWGEELRKLVRRHPRTVAS